MSKGGFGDNLRSCLGEIVIVPGEREGWRQDGEEQVSIEGEGLRVPKKAVLEEENQR